MLKCFGFRVQLFISDFVCWGEVCVMSCKGEG